MVVFFLPQTSRSIDEFVTAYETFCDDASTLDDSLRTYFLMYWNKHMYKVAMQNATKQESRSFECEVVQELWLFRGLLRNTEGHLLKKEAFLLEFEKQMRSRLYATMTTPRRTPQRCCAIS
jgi:hypothetical protein